MVDSFNLLILEVDVIMDSISSIVFINEDDRFKFLLGYLFGLQKVYKKESYYFRVSHLFNKNINCKKLNKLESEILLTQQILEKYFNSLYG
jgi:hypothetical protein